MGRMMVISDIDIEVVKKDIKNIHLAVYPPTGKVRLAVPHDVSTESIELFAKSKLGWIKKQQRRFEAQDRQSERNYVNRETHYFFGKRYLLRVIEGDKPAKVLATRRTQLELHVRPNSTIQQRREVMNEWYRTELKKIVPELIEKWESKMSVKVSAWGIRLMKTKWGTCNRDSKRILLNLELAKIPTRCIEYIVVHELVHLFERKHNENFVTYMNKFLPNWKTLRAELNRQPVSYVSWEC